MREEETKAYGKALYALAREEGLQERILHETEEIAPCFTEAYVRLLASPALSREKAEGLIAELLGGRVHPYLSSFVKLLVKNGLGLDIVSALEAYEAAYERGENVKRVTVESAVPLNENQKARLEKVLTKQLGEPLRVFYYLTPALLGGMRIRCGSWQREDSLQGRLRDLRDLLNGEKDQYGIEKKQGEGE